MVGDLVVIQLLYEGSFEAEERADELELAFHNGHRIPSEMAQVRWYGSTIPFWRRLDYMGRHATQRTYSLQKPISPRPTIWIFGHGIKWWYQLPGPRISKATDLENPFCSSNGRKTSLYWLHRCPCHQGWWYILWTINWWRWLSWLFLQCFLDSFLLGRAAAKSIEIFAPTSA